MKTRARIVSGLAALAALLLAPLAEASLPRTSTPATEASAPALVSPDPESSPFLLFEGNELAGAAAASQRVERFHPLAAVSLLSQDAHLDLAPEADARYPKTRVWAIDVLGSTLVCRSAGLSLESDWACVDFSCGLVSGGRKDPLGLQTGFEEYEPSEFEVDVATEFAKGVFDPRNAWKNAQRAAGGLYGAGKFVAKTAVGLGSLALDTSPLGPAIPGAIERNERRREAVKGFIAHPIDTVVKAHTDTFEKILEHEQRGEQFSSGAEAGELGAADAAAIYGGATAASAVGRLARAGAGRLAASLEASSRWPSIVPEGGWEFPQPPVRAGAPAQLSAGQAAEAVRLQSLGIQKNTAVLRPTLEEMNSAAFRVIVGEPGFTPGGLPRGTIFDATQRGLFEYKSGTSPLGSTYQLRLQTYFALRQGASFTIGTSRPVIPTFADWLARWGVKVEGP
jgi:hypothetical protein